MTKAVIGDCTGLWESKLGLTDQVGMAEDEEIGQDSRVAEKMLTIWSRLSRNASQKIILGTQHRT